MTWRSTRPTLCERVRPLPGDERIAAPLASITHAVTIHASRRAVWPWLAQMGAGRAGWYSYDRLDNSGRPSADEVLPWFQDIGAGTLFPALSGATDGFVVLSCEAPWYLVLAWPGAGHEPMVTWTFALEELAPHVTRLIVRVRGAASYPFYGLPRFLGAPLIRLVHFIMQRKQLIGMASRAERTDTMLHCFMPRYDVVERHRIRVRAPADITLRAAAEVDMENSRVIRAIFRMREIMLRAKPEARQEPRGLVARTTALGWGLLAEDPGHEIVMGAVTRPWDANVVFRALPPAEFAAFNEPGWVKIAWTLRADPLARGETMLQTETRVLSTDALAKAKFRRYWARVVPGVVLIRWIGLRLAKAAAEGERLRRLRQDDGHRRAA